MSPANPSSSSLATRERGSLFEPVQLGAITLANRIVMAPLTRCRALPGGVPGPLIAEHYAQRASAGLIITEGVNISPSARGYDLTPGLYTDEQAEGWRRVTQAVHARGGRIFPQLWHVGRISHPDLQPGGALPVAPSAIRAEGATSYTPSGFKPCPTPRALGTDEIRGIVEDYARAAQRALDAGFDGVEIHAANGYLLEQFLREHTNRRTDCYGGSLEDRARLVLEVAGAVAAVCGAGRTGIRLSPVSPVNASEPDRDPMKTYRHVVERLDALDLAYIHVIEGVTQGPRDVPGDFDYAALHEAFRGRYIANNGYDRGLAIEACAQGRADLVAFGRLFIANPDLVERLRLDAPLNEPDPATYFGGGAEGYNDYPRLAAHQALK
ncbi:alkene reductase [Paraburkholderia lycopersici]|uniref:N-ethylmaleimide reductase n=1 Tax=Paraburkholderia lycopersici TaxID=416944 RepID=A0A1G6QUM8_9BURK|nr:alkene reductase [Paraburkholderia lycopersici]SDC96078.1 N-ethylmaleimide reductase [Paraburkholderia lycopersici]